MDSLPRSRVIRFEDVELHPDTGELCRNGVRTILPDQPLRILEVLLEQPGELVSRERLRDKLWSDQTYVDFEHGLNAAVKRLREALQDSAETPRFIQTLPRRGYRFIAPVQVSANSEGAPSRPRPRALRGALALFGCLSVFTLLALAWVWRSGDGPRASLASPAFHAALAWPSDAPLALGTELPAASFDSPAVAVSPDGSRIAYIGRTGESTRVYLRNAAEVAVQPVAGTEGASHAFFSPDGRWLGFLTLDKVKKVGLSGGAAMKLCDAWLPFSAQWAGGFVYFTENEGTRLFRVPEHGGPCEFLRYGHAQVGGMVSDVLPGGRWALGTRLEGSISRDQASIVLISLERDETRVLVRSGYRPLFAPPDRILFGRGGDLYAMRFDSNRLEVDGQPVLAASGVAMDSLFGATHAAVSWNGVLAYVSGSDRAVGRLTWVDVDGVEERLPLPDGVYGVFQLSPDERHLALHVSDVTDYVALLDLNGSQLRALRTDYHGGWPVWSPDGSRLALSAAPRRAGEPWRMVVMSLGDPPITREILSVRNWIFASSWSPDASRLALNVVGYPMKAGLVPLARAAGWKPDETYIAYPRFSDDGRWLAFQRRVEQRNSEIFVRSYPQGDEVQKIPDPGAVEPVWSGTGELFYRVGRRWRRVFVSGAPLRISEPRPAFETHFVDTPGVSYDVSNDGRRLLVVKRAHDDGTSSLHVRVNWTKQAQ
jgi:DNA-binding winged helix-turn-helix (wHTH) protein/dipeptidyl aminopeptidase/acylaminoacyl peptidase